MGRALKLKENMGLKKAYVKMDRTNEASRKFSKGMRFTFSPMLC